MMMIYEFISVLINLLEGKDCYNRQHKLPKFFCIVLYRKRQKSHDEKTLRFSQVFSKLRKIFPAKLLLR